MSTTMSAGTHGRRARPDFRRSRTADDRVHRMAVERQVKPCNVSRLVFDGATVCPGHRATSHGFTGGLLAVAPADRRADNIRVTSPSTKSAPVEHTHNYDPNRLREYRWKTERDIRRETPEAADRFYKHTYGTAQCSSVELKFPERTIDGHRLRSRLRSLQRAATAESAHTDPALANITSGRILERLRELEQMRHPSAVIDTLQPQDGHRTDDRQDVSLYSQVAQSIGLFSHGSERTRTANFRLRARPAMEYASTPRILSAAAAPPSARSNKSADTYIGYLEGQASTRPVTDAGSGWGGQAPAVYNHTATESRLVQMVADCNSPGGTGNGNGNAQEPTSSEPQPVNSEHCAVSDNQPLPDTSREDKTSSIEHVTSDAKAPENKPPKNGLRKVATVAPPPRKHKSSTVRVACRPVVKKELTIVVPMV
ncbi:hypothetical protein NP493_889g01071 [Ridgeia piscesae]|uniref:Uncharacterized protein n=1 Tax=Ridgeia piscesae TaxID=27915 RepID=A0AAD9NLS4_RIDPI|nr:hypothetical protein NP493_889g01071 [Ridgeia piscesae]